MRHPEHHDPDPEPDDEHGDEHDDEHDEESAYELLQRGHALLRDRHHAQAAIVLERAARLEPGKASILEPLGRARFNAGQHEAARETFEALVAVDPASHYGHFALGESLRKLGLEREAWTHLRVAVALSPSSAVYRSALARVPEPDHAAERRAEDERRASSRPSDGGG
jgi:tetratricopeptide (TPR) repeat protein